MSAAFTDNSPVRKTTTWDKSGHQKPSNTLEYSFKIQLENTLNL